MDFGLALSSEEHGPRELIELAMAAEEVGFDFVSISDHYHPWLTDQGHSPFVWAVLGAISERTTRLQVATGVTCPTFRMHPAIVAQAVATTARLFGDRFLFGVGSGEALNEHITGQRWPPADLRLEMLAEAIEVIRRLLSEDSVMHRGKHYTVENARIFDKPEHSIPILVSAYGQKAAELAADAGDGLWMSTPNREAVQCFHARGGSGPVFGQLTLSFGADSDEAQRIAHRYWRSTTVPGQLSQDLPTISHFEIATQGVTVEQMGDELPCGPDLGPVVAMARDAMAMGVDHLYFHQVGPDQSAFLRAWQTELLPALRQAAADRAAAA